jgi:hypothetical protein
MFNSSESLQARQHGSGLRVPGTCCLMEAGTYCCPAGVCAAQPQPEGACCPQQVWWQAPACRFPQLLLSSGLRVLCLRVPRACCLVVAEVVASAGLAQQLAVDGAVEQQEPAEGAKRTHTCMLPRGGRGACLSGHLLLHLCRRRPLGVMGDTASVCMKAASGLIRRDIVFAASLYVA